MNPNNDQEKPNKKGGKSSLIKAINLLIKSIAINNKKNTLDQAQERSDNIKPVEKDNRIEKKNLKVQVVLAIVTVLLFGLNSVQTCISTNAVREANRANNLTETVIQENKLKAFSDSTHQALIDSVNHVKDSISGIKDNLTLGLATKSLQAQINSIRQTQNEFEIENKPVLQPSSWNMDSLTKRKMNFQINNWGKQPAKIFTISGRLKVSKDSSYKRDEILITKRFNQVVPQYAGVAFSISTNTEGITDNDIIQVKNGTLFLYIIGRVEYENIVAAKRMTYKFIYRFSYNPLFSVDIIKDTVYNAHR